MSFTAEADMIGPDQEKQGRWTLFQAEVGRHTNERYVSQYISCWDKTQICKAFIQGCIFPLTCSHRELTEDHVLTIAYVKIFRTVTRNAVNKSVWRKKDCF